VEPEAGLVSLTQNMRIDAMKCASLVKRLLAALGQTEYPGKSAFAASSDYRS
jgi:hypothetical protein